MKLSIYNIESKIEEGLLIFNWKKRFGKIYFD